MPRRRPLRLLLAALLAVLFGAVSVAHAGAHLGAAPSGHSLAAGDNFDGGMGCALCQNAVAVHSATPLFQAADAPLSRVPVLVSVPVAEPPTGGPSSRGPPV